MLRSCRPYLRESGSRESCACPAPQLCTGRCGHHLLGRMQTEGHPGSGWWSQTNSQLCPGQQYCGLNINDNRKVVENHRPSYHYWWPATSAAQTRSDYMGIASVIPQEGCLVGEPLPSSNVKLNAKCVSFHNCTTNRWHPSRWQIWTNSCSI